jgi:hypothetical protein
LKPPDYILIRRITGPDIGWMPLFWWISRDDMRDGIWKTPWWARPVRLDWMTGYASFAPIGLHFIFRMALWLADASWSLWPASSRQKQLRRAYMRGQGRG